MSIVSMTILTLLCMGWTIQTVFMQVMLPAAEFNTVIALIKKRTCVIVLVKLNTIVQKLVLPICASILIALQCFVSSPACLLHVQEA